MNVRGCVDICSLMINHFVLKKPVPVYLVIDVPNKSGPTLLSWKSNATRKCQKVVDPCLRLQTPNTSNKTMLVTALYAKCINGRITKRFVTYHVSPPELLKPF